MKIMLVEDNEAISRGLAYAFDKNGYDTVCFATVREVSAYLEKNDDVGLIILDVALPDGNGFSLYLNVIRPHDLPVIFLTARDDENDIVRGFEYGAEDYVTKPFSTKELMARVKRILMRSEKYRAVRVGNITFDPDRMILRNGDGAIELTPIELRIVSLLFSNINKVVTRNTLLDKIWDWTGNFVDDHTVTVYLNRIREKIGSDIITTVKGIGYRIDEK